MWGNDAGVAVTDEQQQQEVEVFPTVVEWSSDGALMVELDWQGEGLRVQLEPEVTRSWTSLRVEESEEISAAVDMPR